ncbi:alpha/beta fold hydrolase [Chitinophaga sp. NPDC101104]|uniref:alpha/beta fold hydrolase n=1 Tax=Chitinophaga sp. NPDC101104 TaxID=3390561 RepID=UPI003D08D8A3
MKSSCLAILMMLLATGSYGAIQAFPADSSIITSDGVKLYLKTGGKGSPCIFVHGGPGAWSKSFEVLGGNALESTLTMYYYDQRGSGRSATPANGDFSLARMVEDIEDVRKATGAPQVYLLAHSFGGILAYNYALRYPGQVKGIILLNSTLSINNSLQNQIAFVNEMLGTSFQATDSAAVVATYAKAITALRGKGLGYQMLSDKEANVQLLDSVDNWPERNYTFGRAALGMAEYFTDFTKSSSQLDKPVLVISGATDHNIGPDHYKLFRFPDQRVCVIQGGHMLYYEQNAAFVDAVAAFVR